MRDPGISVIITTRGVKGVQMVDDLMLSIILNKNSHIDQILISNDGYDENVVNGLYEIRDKYSYYYPITVVCNPSTYSYSVTVNNGIKNTKQNNDVLLLNNDMKALSSFDPFIDFIYHRTGDDSIDYDLSRKVGIVGAKLLYPDGRIQHGGMGHSIWPGTFIHLHRSKSSDYGPSNYPRRCISVTGACQYIPRDVINNIGYYDEAYRLSHDDVDYCYQARLYGYEVWYIPYVTLVHYESVTRSANAHRFESQNYKLFWNKWSNIFPYPNHTVGIIIVSGLSILTFIELIQIHK